MVDSDSRDIHISAGCLATHPDSMGGQHVAKSCTGIRIFHHDTQIGVVVNSERSQHANKVKALKLLNLLIGIQ